jgi:hypothetical protein
MSFILNRIHTEPRLGISTGIDDSQSSITDSSINAIIAVCGAIGGAIIGSYLTYIYGKKVEERKEARETEKEEELNQNIINMVRYELQSYSDFLNYIRQHSHTYNGDPPDLIHPNKDAKSEINLRIQTFPKHYSELTIERKATALGGKSMAKVETAYKGFHEFISRIQNSDDIYKSNIENLCEYIRDALGSMKMDK